MDTTGHYFDLDILSDIIDREAYGEGADVLIRVLKRYVNSGSLWQRESALEETREWLRDRDPQDESV